MAPGMTMFDQHALHYLVVVDDQGEVRWFFHAPLLSDRFRLLSNGNIIYVSSEKYMIELDWLGNPVTTWYAAYSSSAPTWTVPVNVRGFHHNVEEMPNGNILALCRDYRIINNFPTSDTDPTAPTTTANVLSDQVVEFTRAGEIVKSFSLFDILDTQRIGHGYRDEGAYDWTHSNAVTYDATSDAYMVSIRHQDAVIKIRRDNGALVWILGNHANWRDAWHDKLLTPLGEHFEWQYHQHAVELIPGGVGVYDNGNFRAPAYETPKLPYYSRVVRFNIDEQAMTVAQDWTYQPMADHSALYSMAMSDADWLPNGNVLVASGTLTNSRPAPGWGQIVEVTEDGDTVFELNVIDSPTAYTVFDADRIPDLRTMKLGM